MLIVLTVLSCKSLITGDVYAASSSFVRQVIEDAENDFNLAHDPSVIDYFPLIETNNNNTFSVPLVQDIAECMPRDSENDPFDIRSISYVSDGKTLNGTIWLKNPVQSLSNDTFVESLEWIHAAILDASSVNNNLNQLAYLINSNLQTHFDNVEINNTNLVSNTYPAYKINYQSRDGSVEYMTFLAVRNSIGYAITYQAPTDQFQESLPEIEERILNTSVIFDLFFTYQDRKSGISIEYPVDWYWVPGTEEYFISTQGSTYNKSVEFFPPESLLYPTTGYLSLTIEDLPSENISLQDYSMEAIRNYSISEVDLPTVNSTFANLPGDIPAYKIEYRFEEDGSEYNGLDVIIKIQQKIYFFTFVEEKSLYQRYLPTVQKMIESFQISLGDEGSNHDLEYELPKIKHLNDWKIGFIKGTMPVRLLFSNTTLLSYSFGSPLHIDKDFSPWQDQAFLMTPSIITAYDRQSVYNYEINWNNTSLGWDKEFSETGLGVDIPAFKQTILKDHNSTDFFSEGKNYVNFNLDLKHMNYPESFSILFQSYYAYLTGSGICTISDISDAGIIPPPQFNITAVPVSLDMKPGDRKEMRLLIKSNTVHEYFLDFSHGNTDSELSLTLPPGREVPISSETLATLTVSASRDTQTGLRTFPLYIFANFPTEAFSSGSNETIINPTNTTLYEEFPITVNILPPEFNITTSLASLDLRPNEERDIIVEVSSDANLNLPLTFEAINPPCPIDVSFLPNATSTVPLGVSTSTMHIKVLENATAMPCPFPIVAEIEGYNNTGTDFTLTVLPALTPEERWQNQLQSIADFISPVNSLWTFVTAVAAVMVPFIVRRLSKKQEKKKKKDDENRDDES